MSTAAAAVTLCALMPVVLHSQTLRRNATLDSLITAQMDSVGIMGLGAAIIVNGQVVWTNGYGYADVKRSKPFMPGTVMNVASITKTIVGVAMMRAVQEGKLSLDTDINTYLPFRVVNPHHPDTPITLRHIATHTSGISDRWEVYRDTYHYAGDAREPLDRFLTDYFVPGGRHYSRDNFLDAAPGTHREYSNIASALAGHIVERAYGEPLNTLTRRLIYSPLGMASTGWFPSEVDTTIRSTLFVSQNGHVIPIPIYEGTTYPDGGVRTSVADLSRFFITMLNRGVYQRSRVLDTDMATEMMRFQFSDANRPANFPEAEGNSGLFWRTKYNGTRVGHGGNDPGLQTEMLADLSGEIGVILFVNTSLGGSDRLVPIRIFEAIWTWAEKLNASP